MMSAQFGQNMQNGFTGEVENVKRLHMSIRQTRRQTEA